ncbi:MAG: twin-arginine translocase subunit TatC [Blautia sp.]|nr:twin-arginine translocase subunit TatC [Blautia sp.]
MSSKTTAGKSRKKDVQQNPDGSMPLTGHLKELRNRIVVCIVVLFAGICLCLSFASRIVRLLTDIGTQFDYHFIVIRPQELLLVYFSVALIGGVVIAVPVIAYQVYAFCAPALDKKGRRTFITSLGFGGVCFCIGIAFAYFIVLPFMLSFLMKFSVSMEIITNNISIGEYVSFLMTVFIIFGIVFEMPVISVLLTRIGILRAEWMARSRKVMIVVIFFVAAIITPPDVVSQVMVAFPMLGLYELSIFLSRLVRSRKLEEAEKEEAEE